MPSILFITPGPIEWASSRMRAHWVAEHLEDAEVMEYNAFDDLTGDIYIFIKVADAKVAQELRDEGKKVFWDICDPVHWFSPKEAYEMAHAVDGIVASNQGLADDFLEWSDLPVKVIKDRLKLDNFTPRETISMDKPVRFIWYGAYQNRFALMAAMTPLHRLKANGIDLTLTICDDQPGIIWEYDEFPILHVKWDLARESKIITAHDIAILPEYPGMWGRVKSNNKHVTAHACGVVPTVGDNWDDLWKLTTDPEYRRERARMGLAWVNKEYNVKQSAQEWKEFINEVS